MEPLQLFSIEALERAIETRQADEDQGSEPITLMSAEHLEVAEAYLDSDQHEGDAKATIETAMFLCEGTGEVSAATLHRLRIDQERYPRAASAVDETRDALALPPSDWPEGFWPRFFLRILAS